MKVGSWIRRKLTQAPQGEASLLSELDFVLVDVDLTGTDIKADAVVGFAALPLIGGRFRLDDLRYCRFPVAADRGADNSSETGAAWQAMIDLLAGRTVFTINPRFVNHMLRQTTALFKLPPPAGDWLDLSAAAAVVGSDEATVTAVSHWQQKMKTGGRQAHDAVYDVFAMAQLLQALLAYAENLGIATIGDLLRNQSAETWLRPY